MTTVSASTEGLAREVGKRQPFTCLEQEVMLNLIRTHETLIEAFDRLFKQHKVSQPLYNILRILRGTYVNAGVEDPESPTDCGVPIQRIGEQMLTREPDMTRLIDRLEKLGFVRRNRCPEDRRVVLVVITQAGLELLERLDQPVMDLHRSQFGHVPRELLSQLNELLYLARHPEDGAA